MTKEENIKENVEFMFSHDLETQKKIAVGLFEYADNLLNENLITKCLNDDQKREWITLELCKEQKENKQLEKIIKDQEEEIKRLWDIRNRAILELQKPSTICEGGKVIYTDIAKNTLSILESESK